jgi:hypothetical protein
MGWDWVHLVRRPLFGLLYQPRMMDVECGALGGMRIDRWNRNTRRKLTLVPFCPSQMSHYLTWARTRAAKVESRRLTAWAMTRPKPTVKVTEQRKLMSNKVAMWFISDIKMNDLKDILFIFLYHFHHCYITANSRCWLVAVGKQILQLLFLIDRRIAGVAVVRNSHRQLRLYLLDYNAL